MFIKLRSGFLSPISSKIAHHKHSSEETNNKIENRLIALGFSVGVNEAKYECKTYSQLCQMFEELKDLKIHNAEVGFT